MAIPPARTAKVGVSRQKLYWWIEIEGIRLRYGSRVPSWSPEDSPTGGTPPGSNRPIKSYISAIPSISAQKAKPLNGTCQPHGFDVELVDKAEDVTSLFSVHDTTNRNETNLDAACTAAASSITVTDTSGFTTPCDIFVERETMRATSAPDAHTLNVTRGMYGSEAAEHNITDADGNARQVIVSDQPRFILTREIVLYENIRGLDEADAVKLRGVIESIKEHLGVWTVSAKGHLGRLDQQIGLNAPRSFIDVYPLAAINMTDEELAELRGAPRFDGHALVTHWWMMVFDASVFASSGAVKVGDEIIRYEATDTGPPNRIIIDNDYSGLNGFARTPIGKGRGVLGFDVYSNPLAGIPGMDNEVTDRLYQFNRFIRYHFPGEEVRQVLTHHDFTAGTDPVSIVLQVLLSKEGDGSNDATYDTLPKGWGLGLPSSVVDKTGMLALRDTLGSQDWDMHFAIVEPVSAKKWLEEHVLRPTLLFFREQWDGAIGLARVYSKDEAVDLGSDLDITESILAEIPGFDHGRAPMGKIEIACNYYPPWDEYLGKLVVRFGDSEDIYRGQADSFKIECQTLYDHRLNGGGSWSSRDQGDLPEFASSYIQPITNRFAFNPPPRLRVVLGHSYKTKVPVGAIVTVTSSATPNPKQRSRGLSGEWFQVTEAKPDPAKGTIELTLWMIDIHDNDYRKIAPAAEVASWASGTNTITITTEVFVPAGDDESDYFNAGDKVRIMTSQFHERTPGETMTVASAGSGVIVLTGAPTDAPVAGDFVVTAPYGSASTTQVSEWAYQAGADQTLGAASADGHLRI